MILTFSLRISSLGEVGVTEPDGVVIDIELRLATAGNKGVLKMDGTPTSYTRESRRNEATFNVARFLLRRGQSFRLAKHCPADT